MSNAPIADLAGSDIAVGTWTLDPSATTVAIRHRTMWGLVAVKGRFSGVHGAGTVTADHRFSGAIVLDSASLDTGNAKRDEHIRSAELLDAEAHPQISVAIASGAADGDELRLEATITAKGVQRPLPLQARITDLSATRIAATVTGRIDRQELGLTWNKLGMMKDITEISVDAAFVRPQS